jgi:hypothetical protein
VLTTMTVRFGREPRRLGPDPVPGPGAFVPR